MSEPSAEQPTKAPVEPGSEDFQPLATESAPESAPAEGGEPEPQAQPFEEPVEGGDPASTEGADIPDENLDLAPADSTDHSDQTDAEAE